MQRTQDQDVVGGTGVGMQREPFQKERFGTTGYQTEFNKEQPQYMGRREGTEFSKGQQEQIHGHKLHQEMERALVRQANAELWSSHQKLGSCAFSVIDLTRLAAAALWCEDRQFRGFAHLLLESARDEVSESLGLQCYIIKRRGLPLIDRIPEPQNNFKSIVDVVQHIYNVEVEFTKKINSLLLYAEELKDVPTCVFLRLNVQHQIESCDRWFSILEKTHAYSQTPGLLYKLDREFLVGPDMGKLGKELHKEYHSGRYADLVKASGVKD